MWMGKKLQTEVSWVTNSKLYGSYVTIRSRASAEGNLVFDFREDLISTSFDWNATREHEVIPLHDGKHLSLHKTASLHGNREIFSTRWAKMMEIYVRDIFTSSQKCCLASHAFALVCLWKINREKELQGIQSDEGAFTSPTLRPKNTNPSSWVLASEIFIHRNLIKKRTFVPYGWGLWWWYDHKTTVRCS